MQIGDRVAAADRGFTLSAKHHVERSRFEVWRPRKTDERREIIIIVVIQRYAGFAAHKLLCSNALCLTAGSRGGFEKISKSRYPVQIGEFRLDRQRIRNGRDTHIVP